MKVRCTANTGDALPRSCLDAGAGITAQTVFPLTVGRVYTVYAITTFKSNVWYYVFDDNQLPYPVWRLAPLFEVADPRLPDSWIFGYVRRDMTDPGFPLISFPEWAEDHFFYERLVEGDGEAARSFEEERRKIEDAY